MAVTAEMLANAEADLQTLSDVINGSATDPDAVNRVGDHLATLARLLALIESDTVEAQALRDETSALKDQTEAARDVALATPVAELSPPTDDIILPDGSSPALVLDGPSMVDGLNQIFVAFKKDGTWVSNGLAAFILNMLGGASFTVDEIPGWDFTIDAPGSADGLNYILAGRRSDGTWYPSATVGYDYIPGAALPLADRPVWLSTGWNGIQSNGQSNSLGEGSFAAPPVSTTPSAYDLTFGGGGRTGKTGNTCSAIVIGPGTSTVKALVEQTDNPAGDGTANAGETIHTAAASAFNRYAARYLNLDPSTLVKLRSSTGHGAYKIQDLMKVIGAGAAAAWYNQYLDHTNETKARAIAVGKTYALHVIDYIQGEGDAGVGTAQATYTTKLIQHRANMSADALAITGQPVPVHMLLGQITGGVAGTSLANTAAIQQAQLDAISQDPFIHLATPLYMIPHSVDGLHMPASGNRWLGEYFGRAEAQLIILGRVPDRIWPVSAIAGTGLFGPQIELLFDVPQRPLVFDSTLIGLAKDYGFEVRDDVGALTLSNFRVVNGNKVVANLNRLPTVADPVNAPATVSYAQANLAPGLALTGASGNLRDSTPDTFIDTTGVERPLAIWCPHFRIPVRSEEY
jgi:hypothetical protein